MNMIPTSYVKLPVIDKKPVDRKFQVFKKKVALAYFSHFEVGENCKTNHTAVAVALPRRDTTS